MALFDFLKRKRARQDATRPTGYPGGKQVEKPARKSEPVEACKKPDKSASRNLTGKTKSHTFSFDAIKQPHISEKATYLSEKEQYIFEVLPNFNKNEIKKAVEGIYGVDVLSVNLVKIPAKKRRLGKTEGFRRAYKKAIVKIKEGQKIEIL